MKDRIGFNLIFAMLAFPIGLAMFQEFDFDAFTFRKKVLGTIYLVTFVICIYLTFKKKKQSTDK